MFYQFNKETLTLFSIQNPESRELANFVGTNKFTVHPSGYVHIDGIEHREYFIDKAIRRNMIGCLDNYAAKLDGKTNLTQIDRSGETREQKFSRMITMIKTGKVERVNNGLKISEDFTIKLESGRDGDVVYVIIDGKYHNDIFSEEEVSRIHDADNFYKDAQREQEKKELFMSRNF